MSGMGPLVKLISVRWLREGMGVRATLSCRVGCLRTIDSPI